MPCTDGGPSQSQIDSDARLSSARERLACERIKWYKTQPGGIPNWAQEYARLHAINDQARKNYALELRKQRKARRAAISKLTKSELEALGISTTR